MIQKTTILLLAIAIVLAGFMLLNGEYVISFSLIVCVVLILFLYGRLSAGGYIQRAILFYIQKRGEVTKQELIEYIRSEIQDQAHVNVEGVVDEILAILLEKQKISIENGKISLLGVKNTRVRS